MTPKRTERSASSRSTRKKTIGVSLQSPPAPVSALPEFPLTLRNLRLGIAGRLGRPFTQAEAAKKAKISRTHLTNVERGAQNASAFLLFRLHEVYGCRLEIVHAAYAGSQRKLDDESD